MSAAAQGLLGLSAVVLTVATLRLVGRRKLRSKYALLWLAVTVPLVPLAAFPGILDWFGEQLGVHYAPALLFALADLLLLAIIIHYSWELSRVEVRLRRLGEEVALLQARLDEANDD